MNKSTMTWGIPLITLTLLTGLLVPSPVNLWIIGGLILASFVVYVTVDNITPIVPAITTYVGAYLGLIEFYDPTVTAWLFIGIAFIAVGIILQDDEDTDWKSLPKASLWIGGIIAGSLTIWLLLVQINLDDNVSRWGNNIMHKIDPAEYQKQTKQRETPTKEVIPNRTKEKSPDANRQKSSASKDKPILQDEKCEQWTFTWKSETDSASYPVNFTKFSSFKVEFSARWQSAGEIGKTDISLKRKDCFDCFHGRIMVAEAGKVPFAQGSIALEKQSEGCFSGSFNTRGYPVKAKLHTSGERCQY